MYWYSVPYEISLWSSCCGYELEDAYIVSLSSNKEMLMPGTGTTQLILCSSFISSIHSSGSQRTQIICKWYIHRERRALFCTKVSVLENYNAAPGRKSSNTTQPYPRRPLILHQG